MRYKNTYLLFIMLFCVAIVLFNVDKLAQVRLLSLDVLNSGSQSITFARDLVERAPLYLDANPRLHNKHWHIERSIFEEYEFEAWELYAYLLAQSVSVDLQVPRGKCEELKKGGAQLSNFDIRVLKGDATSGYSAKNGQFVLMQNNRIGLENNELHVIDCPDQSTIIMFLE